MSKPQIVVRAADAADYPAIAALLDKILSPRPYEQRVKLWRWRDDANPARTEVIPPFLVGEQGGNIVAAHGLIPLRIKVTDKILVASCSCDLAADPSARSAGLKIKLEAMNWKISPLHISTSANETANKITLALGGKEVGIGRRKLIAPLKVSAILRSTLSRSLSGAAGAAVAAVGGVIVKPLDWVLAIERAVRSYPKLAGAEIEEISEFDQRFDRFWETVSQEYDIIHVRDAAYLNWRYAQYPFGGIESFALIRENEVLGLAVIHESVDDDGTRFVAILEQLAPRNDPAAFDQLLGEVIRRSARAGAHIITARTSIPLWEQQYRKPGFRLRRAPFSPVTYKNNSEFPDDLFAADASWYVSLGDGDGCYYFE